jgi:hypothetical protein
MSSSDYTNLRKLRQTNGDSVVNNNTSGERTQQKLVNTIVNNKKNNLIFDVPLYSREVPCGNLGATGSCTSVPIGGNPLLTGPSIDCSIPYYPPGYNTIGRDGPTGPAGDIGPTGPIGHGVEGPPGLSLEYNLFMSFAGGTTPTIPANNGKLLSEPSILSSGGLTYTFALNDETPRLLAKFTTDFTSISTTAIAPGLWDMNFYASTNQTNGGVLVYMKVIMLDASANPYPLANGEPNPTVILGNNRHTHSVYIPYSNMPDLSSNICIELYGKQCSCGAVPNTLTFFYNPPTLSYIRTTLANQTLPIGPTGPIGATGEQGVSGEATNTGATGPTGERGPNGERGYTGPRGDAGPEGPVGPAFGTAGKLLFYSDYVRSSANGAWGDIKIYDTHKYRANVAMQTPSTTATNTIWLGSNWLPDSAPLSDVYGSYYLSLVVPPDTPSILQVEVSGWMWNVSNGSSIMTVTRNGTKVYSRRRASPYATTSTYIVRHIWNDFREGDVITFMGYESTGEENKAAPPIVDDFAASSIFAYSVSSGLQITSLS